MLSGEHTSRFIEPLLRWLSFGMLTPEQVAWVTSLIRKAGHLTEYAVLSVLFWFALGRPRLDPDAEPHNRGPWLAVCLAVVLSVAYAALDEYHQSFVPSRTSSWHDVAIDAGGAILGLTLLGAAKLGHGRWEARKHKIPPVLGGLHAVAGIDFENLVQAGDFENLAHAVADRHQRKFAPVTLDALHRVDENRQPRTVDVTHPAHVEVHARRLPGDERVEPIHDLR